MATVIAHTLGYEVLELNASDTRNKKAIHEELADAVLTQAMGSDGSAKKRLVIMDEVDGMGGNDRGGLPELLKVPKHFLLRLCFVFKFPSCSPYSFSI